MSRFLSATSLQRIDAGSPASLDDQEPFSITAWILPLSSGPASGGRIMSKNTGAGFWDLQMADTTGTFLFTKDYATTDLVRVTTVNSLTLGVWNHIACTWDGSVNASGVLFYVNGRQANYSNVDSTNGAGAKNSDATARLLVGNRGVTNRPFHGEIAYVTFHKRVLSIGEIGQVMAFPGSVDWSKEQLFLPNWSPGAGVTGSSTEPDYGAAGNFATATSCISTSSSPQVNGMAVIPFPQFVGCG